MKIACLTHYYIEENRAGGEMMMHALLKRLVQEGHDVTAYITKTTRPDSIVDGVKVVYTHCCLYELDIAGYDLIISQFENSTMAIKHAHRNGRPVCIVVHNHMVQGTIDKLLPNDFVVYNTKWLQKLYKTPCRSVVVHPPLNIDSHVDPLDVSQRQYVTLVNLTKAKGSSIFYGLAENLPDVQFLGVKGGYFKEHQVIRDLPNVTIIENTDNMYRDVYSKSKLILMPSNYETYGMVAAEAAHYGIPVVCTDLPGLNENLGNTGLYVKDNMDLTTYYELVNKLLKDDEFYHMQSMFGLFHDCDRKQEAELYTFAQVINDYKENL